MAVILFEIDRKGIENRSKRVITKEPTSIWSTIVNAVDNNT